MEIKNENTEMKVVKDQYDQSKVTNENLNTEIVNLQRQQRSTGSEKDKTISDLNNLVQERDTELERLQSTIRMSVREVESLQKQADAARTETSESLTNIQSVWKDIQVNHTTYIVITRSM